MASKRFPFKQVRGESATTNFMPYLPLSLVNGNYEIEVLGLMDTGATVNVMPYQVGLDLGAVWEDQTTTLRLSGNLAHWEARALIVTAKVEGFDDIRMAFAWTQSEQTPLILGQINFFMAFNVCFFRENLSFEIDPVLG
jgi:hypothetical protein